MNDDELPYRNGLLREAFELGREFAFRDSKLSAGVTDVGPVAAAETRRDELCDILGSGDVLERVLSGYRSWWQEWADCQANELRMR